MRQEKPYMPAKGEQTPQPGPPPEREPRNDVIGIVPLDHGDPHPSLNTHILIRRGVDTTVYMKGTRLDSVAVDKANADGHEVHRGERSARLSTVVREHAVVSQSFTSGTRPRGREDGTLAVHSRPERRSDIAVRQGTGTQRFLTGTPRRR